MTLYVAIHNHRFGQTVHNFRTEEPIPVSLMESQLERLASFLGLEYDSEDDFLSVIQESEDEFPVLSAGQLEYILTGQGEGNVG